MRPLASRKPFAVALAGMLAVLITAAGAYIAHVSSSDERMGRDAAGIAAPMDIARTQARTAQLLFVGDIMLDRGVRAKVFRAGVGDPNFSFMRIREYLGSFDAVIANLEGPVSDVGERVGSIYSFRMNPDVVPALVTASVRAVNFANNHVWDYGRAAFDDTRARLSAAGIGYFGAGHDAAEAYAPRVLEIEGMKVALVGFTEFLQAVEATEERSGIAIANQERVRAAIGLARQRADVVVASFHMGEEYRAEPVERQRALAHAAIDAGADLVVGHHPHVIETREIYRGRDIYYSLGNFVFDQSFSTSTMTAGYLEVDVTDGKISRTALRAGIINRDYQPLPPSD